MHVPAVLNRAPEHEPSATMGQTTVVAERLFAVRPELRIRFISGCAHMAPPLDPDNPNVGFLSKPFQPSVLTLPVRETLSRPGTGRVA